MNEELELKLQTMRDHLEYLNDKIAELDVAMIRAIQVIQTQLETRIDEVKDLALNVGIQIEEILDSTPVIPQPQSEPEPQPEPLPQPTPEPQPIPQPTPNPTPGPVPPTTSRPDWFIRGETITKTASGQTFPANGNALASAMKLAKPGDRIGFVGTMNGFTLCRSELWTPSNVWRGPVGGPYEDIYGLEIFGMDETAKVQGGFEFCNQYGIPHDLFFHDFDVINGGQRMFVTYTPNETQLQRGQFYTGLKFHNMNLYCQPGTQFIFRLYATQFDIKNVHHRTKVTEVAPPEHFIYSDNSQGDSFVTDCTSERTKRTCFHINNRTEVRVPGHGNLTVTDVTATEPGWGEGASAFSCQGFNLNGTLTWNRCKTVRGKGGGMVAAVTGPTALHPSYFDGPQGNGHIVVKDCIFDQSLGDRPVMMISSCKSAVVDGVQMTGNQAAANTGLWLEPYGDPNRDFRFGSARPSAWMAQNWNVPVKMKIGPHGQERSLTTAEIDGMYRGT